MHGRVWLDPDTGEVETERVGAGIWASFQAQRPGGTWDEFVRSYGTWTNGYSWADVIDQHEAAAYLRGYRP